MLPLDRETYSREINEIGLLPGPPQVLCLVAHLKELYSSMSLPPVDARQDEDFPGPTDRWYGKLGSRYLTLDVGTLFWEQSEAVGLVGVTVTTNYPPAATGSYDWTTLRELSGLPPAIDLRNIGTVTSRVEKPAFCVYRRDERGFDFPVYFASCELDAAGLLQFLNNERRYFAGLPEPEGDWFVERIESDGRRIVIGHYSDRAGTITVACNVSNLDELMYRVYPAPDNADRSVWHVSRGRVVDQS
jgi:hypothetical protein